MTNLKTIDSAPRYIDPNTPLLKQVAVLDLLRKSPPENSRRVTITPELAEHILVNLQEVNRPRRAAAVRRYAVDMVDGLWRLTGDTIKFGKSGKLRDGQHRLAACVRAGTPFSTFILFGIEDDVFDVMDTGRKRDGSDTFAIASVKNASSAAGAVRWHMIFTGGDPRDRGKTFTNREMLEYYNKLNTTNFDDAVADAKAACRNQRGIHEAALAALVYIYRKKHLKAVAQFLDDLKNEKGGACKLMERLDRLKSHNLGRIHENQRNAMIVLTLNCYANGTRVSTPKNRNGNIDWNETLDFPVFA